MPTPGGLAAQLAKTDDAEGLAAEAEADTGAKIAGPRRRVFDGNPFGQRQDQRPGVLGRRIAEGRRAGHGDAVLARRLGVQGPVAHAAGIKMLLLGQFFDQRARKRRAFAHHADDLEIGKPCREGVFVRQVIMENADLHVTLDCRPIGQFQGNPFVIIDDGEFFHGPGLTP